MQVRRFGDTDLEVSPICFGPMRFANRDGSDDDVVIDAVVEPAGVALFDAALAIFEDLGPVPVD